MMYTKWHIYGLYHGIKQMLDKHCPHPSYLPNQVNKLKPTYSHKIKKSDVNNKISEEQGTQLSVGRPFLCVAGGTFSVACSSWVCNPLASLSLETAMDRL